nr:alpha/beta hydrolase [Rhodococcus sp. (in: high G+C Gram-positive bacteria)]
MPTVRVDGAEIYHEIQGTGDPVLLLHGGFYSIEIMRPQMNSLSPRYRVHAPERTGHGRTPDSEDPFTYAAGLADTLAYMDAVGLKDPHIIGFSDGAIIGLLLAMKHPERIRSLISISGNLHPSGFVGDDSDNWKIARPPGPDIAREHYDALSPDGPKHGDVVMQKLMRLWTTEPDITPAELSTISVPTLVMAGDRDSIRAEHSRLIATSIPRGELCIVPGVGHGLMERQPAIVDVAISSFLTSSAV